MTGSAFQDVNTGLIYTTEQQPPMRVLVDELVVDTAPIPCD